MSDLPDKQMQPEEVEALLDKVMGELQDLASKYNLTFDKGTGLFSVVNHHDITKNGIFITGRQINVAPF